MFAARSEARQRRGFATRPLAALGQKARSRIVDVLAFESSLAGNRPSFAPAQRRLAEMGDVEGHNLALEYRLADNQEDRLAALEANTR
jgi:putative ABC transport system substrate-binding protein